MTYAGIILLNEGKILLQFRDNNPNITWPNSWAIFGGGIEKGETPKQAIIRELQEELDLKIENPELVLKNKFKGETRYTFKQVIKDISTLKLKEGKKMRFFSKEEILDLKDVVPSVKKLIKKLL
jgi:8-oxo-dGTP diphosphatase